MYGSYSSYSSMYTTTAPMDIGPGSYLSRDASSCAFPSWPRRSSLSESDHEERATSFLSDEDLFPSDPFEDDARSVSSSSSSNSSPNHNGNNIHHYNYHRFQNVDATAVATGAMEEEYDDAQLQILQMQRQQKLAYQREAMRLVLDERDRRRQAMKQRQRRGSAKKSPKAKTSVMTPIAE